MKSPLNEKESSWFTSRPCGCFFKTLYFPHASDWRFRESSLSGRPVAVFISFKSEQNVLYSGRAKRKKAAYFIREEIVILEVLEQHKNDKRNGGHRQIVLPRLELDPDICSTHRRLPGQPSTGMLREVIHFE